MKLELYHLISDPESAEVRKHLVQTGWADKADFRNVHYESHAEALRALTGDSKVPVLVVHADGKAETLKGKDSIARWLSSAPKT